MMLFGNRVMRLARRHASRMPLDALPAAPVLRDVVGSSPQVRTEQTVQFASRLATQREQVARGY